MTKRKITRLFAAVLIAALTLTGCASENSSSVSEPGSGKTAQKTSIPSFSGTYSIAVNSGKPYFTSSELKSTKTGLHFSSLDSLGRAQSNYAVISRKTITSESRGSIGMIKPSGWHTIRYSQVGSGSSGYLYNRSHLIGFQFYGNATNVKENLITGTRYFNADEDNGMLHYEMELRSYLNTATKTVIYRVTPYYTGNSLVADGVLMEAESIEDKGRSYSMCVFVYNEQPGIYIDHTDGSSHVMTSSEKAALKSGSSKSSSSAAVSSETPGSASGSSGSSSSEKTYILNTSSKKFHLSTCRYGKMTAARNRKTVKATRSALISEGYDPCGYCNP